MPVTDIRIELGEQRSVFRQHIHIVMDLQMFVFIAEKKNNSQMTIGNRKCLAKAYNIENDVVQNGPKSVLRRKQCYTEMTKNGLKSVFHRK